MSAEPTAANTETPDVAIRARPPSPKRLSRKILLAGAGLAAVIITFAVITGLSATAPSGRAREEAASTVTNPPESVALASSQYDATDLDSVGSGEAEPSLAPPADPAWAGESAGETGQNAVTHPAPPDPEMTARASPILFATPSAARPEARADANARLNTMLVPPRSPYELQAGSVIAAALVTGLNSDLPGNVIAQVTAPVFDSVTGAHLLIPQGARLIGAYDNSVRHGDRRIVLAWTRLILPNGWSIDLQNMPGSDPAGAAGVSDRTDNHLLRLGGAVGLSAIISVIANNAEDDEDDQSLSQNLGDAAAQQAAQTGGRIVDRELAVRPTLRVRPGASVRVLVMRDIALRPYIEGVVDGGRRTP
jgi:type IV secretion system protein TrbI